MRRSLLRCRSRVLDCSMARHAGGSAACTESPMMRSGFPWASRSNCKNCASYSRSSPQGEFAETAASNNGTSTKFDLLIGLLDSQAFIPKVPSENSHILAEIYAVISLSYHH